MGGLKSKGFTIVELLIVIVVIGVLAAIVIVAYTGVQNRAANTKRIAAAKDWLKTITGYTQTNGSYPSNVLNNHVCLGTGLVTDLDANADEDCFGSGNVKHPISAVNNAFKAPTGSLPSYPNDKLAVGGAIGTVSGLSLRAFDTLDPSGTPKAQYPMLYYWLSGNNQDCILRPIAVPVSGGFASSSTATYTFNEGAFTRCVILLPDPSAL